MPKFSIIVPVYNSEKTIRRCLDSIEEQTINDFEVLLVDNASCDESVEYLHSLDLDINVIENSENVSFSKGNNDAAKIANGEYDQEDLAIYMELIKAHFYADGIINCPYIEDGNIVDNLTLISKDVVEIS